MQIEPALATLEEKIIEAQKASDALSKALKRLRQAAQTGNIIELEKGLPLVGERISEADRAARSLAEGWKFDAKAHLASGYAGELREAARNEGVRLIERDGRLYAFPVLLRIDASDPSVRIGKKRERRIRPRHLAKLLADRQKRPQLVREDRFLSILYEVYRQVAGEAWRKTESGFGPAISLGQLHELLTIWPGNDYSLEEFGRDLLLLDRKPDLRTKDGAAFEFQGAALARGSMKRITVYDENGNERPYIAIRFMKGQ